jgi:hypothetical protein
MAQVLADYGKIRTYGTAACCISVAVIVVIIGIIILRTPNVYTSTATATTSNVNCSSSPPSTCSLSVTFTPTGTSSEITVQNVSWSGSVANGAKVTVYYDPKDPTKCAQSQTNPKFGWFFILFGLLMALCGSSAIAVFSSLSEQSKSFVGGVEGVSNLAGAFRDSN